MATLFGEEGVFAAGQTGKRGAESVEEADLSKYKTWRQVRGLAGADIC